MEQKTIPIQEHKLKIIKIVDEAPEVKTFRVGILKETEIDFYPGQFFMVRFPDDSKLQRAYSIASSPENKEYMDITIELAGEFTTKLFKSKVNDELIFKGPFGKFHFTEAIKNDLILINGGCGISASMSIIRYCTDKKLQNKINLIYSVKTPADIIYNEELKKIKEQNKNFNYIVTITRSKPEHNWQGRTGRIDGQLLKQNIDNFEENLYFICGPLEFVKGTIEKLESLGVTKEQIKTDVWGE